MQATEYIINLDLKANERWKFLEELKTEIHELLDCYLKDFEDFAPAFEAVEFLGNDILPVSYREEIRYISTLVPFTENEILVANLYYDILKLYFGCTAFAISTNEGILHARNLDWHTDNHLLSKYTKVFNFQKAGKTIYKTIGWPGFIGTLSGMRVGSYSITLNAVTSDDEPQIARPISFFIRDVLENAKNFDEAKQMLETTKIASDCLLLLSGIKNDEKVVIERTPTRFATRHAVEGIVAVTNEYKLLPNHSNNMNLLQSTACGRYERAILLAKETMPINLEECMSILKDSKVKMGITVQQMVFNNQTSELLLNLPY